MNMYNHNYENKYCSCNGDDEGEMAQCFICEDWYHSEHLSLQNGVTIGAGELICKICLKNKLYFLEDYPVNEFLKIEKVLKPDDNLPKNEVEVIIQQEGSSKSSKKRKFEEAFPNEQISPKKEKTENVPKNENFVINVEEEIKNNFQKELSTPFTFCKRNVFKSELNKSNFVKILDKDIIISLKKFANVLCKCDSCVCMYNDLKIGFISDPNMKKEWDNRILFEDQINNEVEEDSDENQRFFSQLNSVNMFSLNEIKNLPVEKVKFNF